MKTSEKKILVNAPVAQIYEQWLRFEDLPRFLNCPGEVKRIDGKHFSFNIYQNGKEQCGLIEVVRQIPERRIAWRIVPDNVGLGVVTFEPRSENVTEVTLKLRSVFEQPMSAESAEEYLINFKKLIEI